MISTVAGRHEARIDIVHAPIGHHGDMPAARSPIGRPTRGTTGTNRLRRVDRWIAHQPALHRDPRPLVADVGFGASAVTSLELWSRLRRVAPGVEVVGFEIDPDRVDLARGHLARVRRGETPFPADAGVSFAHGGFEVPTARRPTVIRAMNVLRQYDEPEVADAWRRMAGRLAEEGVLVEGTCDEVGRIGAWVDVAGDGAPQRLTLSLRLRSLGDGDIAAPSIVAERLPKALIHRNVPGERVHALLTALDDEWARAAGLAPFGPVQRWIGAVEALRAGGWPVVGGRTRWRLGELTLPWSAVAPR